MAKKGTTVRFNDKTDQAFRQATGDQRRNLRRLSEDMVEIAKVKSPVAAVKGGTNRASISSDNPTEFWFRVFTTSAYGAWLELGTTKMPARPYFAPAFQEAHNNMFERIRAKAA